MSVRMHEEDPFSAWLVRLQICSRRALRSSGRPRSDHEDIVGSVLADAVAAGPALMERYPNASVYASVRTAHAAESHYRRERVQRGEGARIVTGGDPPEVWYYTDDHYETFRGFEVPANGGTR